MLPVLHLGPLALPTYPTLLGAALVIAFGLLLWLTRGQASILARFDAGLGALLGAVIGARLGHVLLNGAYFRQHVEEAWNLRAGGLDWHGAVLGGLVGLLLVARWRRVPLRPVLDGLALAVQLIGLSGWAGCLALPCAYGAEVWTLADFPGWVVSERPDLFNSVVPRYNTQVFGLALGAALFALVALLVGRGWLRGMRLWPVLALTGAGMFVIGFFRGDGAPGPLPNLSWDQALDLGVIALSLILAAADLLARRAGGTAKDIP